jgi:predicted PurR-regulated permease PerM
MFLLFCVSFFLSFFFSFFFIIKKKKLGEKMQNSIFYSSSFDSFADIVCIFT